MTSPILIVGASVRAAAFSALRAGLTPRCADLFADADLRSRCRVLLLSGTYPGCLRAAVAADGPGPWTYTGGLENEPDLVGELAERRPLWGNGASVLRTVREPAFLAGAARRAGLASPRLAAGPPDPSVRWLLKPRRGAGGTGIRPWQPGDPGHDPGRCYLQEWIEGVPVAAAYAALPSRCECLGVTRQLVGTPWLHAGPFRYCGSVGPLPLPPRLLGRLARLGEIIREEGRVRGLFGIDGILAGEDFFPVEMNPRYTASMEVLEYATGIRVLGKHQLAFDPSAPAAPEAAPPPAGVVGKAILFAAKEVVFPDAGPWERTLTHPPDVHTMPDFADLPHPGERIPRGRPVLTVFGRAGTVISCLGALRKRAGEVERRLLCPR